MEDFKKITLENFGENIFKLIGKDWALITTKKPEGGFNTMTASWGGAGILWNKPVVFIFIRPQRYSYQLIEKTDTFTLSFLDNSYRDKLSLCGKVSGRDIDKINECGFTVVPADDGAFIGEANIAITCRKLYFNDIKECGFVDKSLLSNYPANDFHRMFVGEITGIFIK
ncbi:MAG: flavin reductase family protein [Bacillota bacterium]|nr:flavin reductase family protein [Bacillota bacterium]